MVAVLGAGSGWNNVECSSSVDVFSLQISQGACWKLYYPRLNLFSLAVRAPLGSAGSHHGRHRTSTPEEIETGDLGGREGGRGGRGGGREGRRGGRERGKGGREGGRERREREREGGRGGGERFSRQVLAQ